MLKIYLIVFLIISSFLLASCNRTEEVVKPVPTASIEKFESDTKEIIKMMGSKIEKLESFEGTESEKIKQYLGKYDENPRLNKEQESVVFNIVHLNMSYQIYSLFKESDEKDSIKAANSAIEYCFNQLKLFEQKGYQIK
ncbi:hypothetical protein [Paenibacillus naphthalenovorans]|uniref:hypothetical protein n=1 Tax=Paenibacillus naphthalenovorans TaxID=162209 RepID=UPI003D2C68C0